MTVTVARSLHPRGDATMNKPMIPRKSASPSDASSEPSHLVGVGGSAGSLEPLERFFSALHPDTTMSFVVVTHRDPRSKEMMAEILTRFTPMKVCEAADGTVLERGAVYVVPSDKHLDIRAGRVHLLDRPTDIRRRAPIDALFRAIAADRRERGVGVVLSGMGADGTVGLAAIKDNHGIGLVQDAASSTYDAMPRSAIAAGLADFVGTPESLAQSLDAVAARATTTPLDVVLEAVRTRTGHDFSQYKRNTLQRRIEHRMQLLRVSSLPGYVDLLARSPQEIDLLLADLLWRDTVLP